MSKPTFNVSKPRISVVIPAYNEEEYLGTCLEAITDQAYKPFEVIVVDNGSLDQTVAIAQSFPGVRVVAEPTHGIFAAVTTGFDEARGSIIARTDADSRPEADWLEAIVKAFEDEALSALSGPIYYYDLPLAGLIRRGENFIRGRLAVHSGEAKFLTGANMAIRRPAWLEVKSKLCRRPGIHEDLDLAIHLQEDNRAIGFFSQVVVSTSARRITAPFRSFYKYLDGYESIYLEHGIKRSWVLKVPFLCYVPFQPLIKIIYRLYNSNLNQATLNKLVKLFITDSNY